MRIGSYYLLASLHPVDVQVIDMIIQTIPAQKGSEPYIQWLSNLEKGLAELRSEDVRRILNSCRLHLLVRCTVRLQIENIYLQVLFVTLLYLTYKNGYIVFLLV